MNPKIILASTSPRRKELLLKTGLKFEVVSPKYEEDMALPLSPKNLVIKLSRGKAESVARRYSAAVIIAADTFIVFGNKVLGKPKNRRDAARMLRQLSGTKHSVLTGLCIIYKNKIISKAIESKIHFRKMSENEIQSYIATKEPLDKAGAYAVQGLGGMFIDKIEGDFSGAIGLPLGALARGLKKVGIDIFRK